MNFLPCSIMEYLGVRLNYVLNNPIKAGVYNTAEDNVLYSSACFYRRGGDIGFRIIGMISTDGIFVFIIATVLENQRQEKYYMLLIDVNVYFIISAVLHKVAFL